MFKSKDLVTHKRRGTYGIILEVNPTTITVLWHLGKGARVQYRHVINTKVLSLFIPWERYKEFYEKDRATLAHQFGVTWTNDQNRVDILATYLDSMSERFSTKGSLTDSSMFGDVESVDNGCDCLTRETTTLRNVITSRTLQDMQDMIGPARAAMDFNVRATGRSSGIALKWLAACIESPYVWHKATDHPVNGKAATTYMNEELFHLAQRITATLEWKGWELHKTDGIRFVPIVKETTKYEQKTIITSLR